MVRSKPLGIDKKEYVERQAVISDDSFRYETNQSLQNLSSAIISLSLQNEKLNTRFSNEKKAMEIDFENHKHECQKTFAMIDARISEFEKGILTVVKNITKQMGLGDRLYASQDDVHLKFKMVSDWIESLQLAFDKLTSLVTTTGTALKGQLQSEIDQVRVDLTPVKPEINSVLQEVDEKLEIFRVDFEGLVKEINLLKKSDAYDQKKFENIYTLLSRLREGS